VDCRGETLRWRSRLSSIVFILPWAGHLSVSRDDLTASLKEVAVGIKFEEPLSGNDLWIAELATNLLARLYPRIAITGPEKDRATLRALALDINPDIEIV